MFRQSSSRNKKSKGVKVKHVLQICLLVAICFWLVYQVKHSLDKRKEFGAKENGEEVLEKPDEVRLKLGRKDLPRDEEKDEKVGDGEKQNEEVENVEDVEEEKKPQIEEEQEQEVEIKVGGKEDDERGNGDDELDEIDQEKLEGEIDQEKLEGEIDREEDIIGEEREREEEDREAKDRQREDESLLDDQEEREDGNGKNTHEAREEHYKADDASSEVTHDIDSLIDYPDMIVKSSNTHEISDRNNSDPLLANDQNPENITSLNATAGEEKLTETISLHSNDLSLNSTELVKEKPGAPLQNSTEIIFDSTQSQKTMEGGTMIKEDANSTKNGLSEKMFTSNKTSAANESSENNDFDQNANSGSSEETKRTDDEESNSDSSMVNETIDDSVQRDPIDASDSVLREEQANRIDLDTLPDIKSEGIDNEDAAAE